MLAARCDEVTPRRFRAAATATAPPMVAAAMKSNGFLSDGARIVFKFGDGSLVGGAPGPKLPHKWRRRQRASIVRARRGGGARAPTRFGRRLEKEREKEAKWFLPAAFIRAGRSGREIGLEFVCAARRGKRRPRPERCAC